MAGWRPRIPKLEREVELGDGTILFGFDDGFNEAKIFILGFVFLFGLASWNPIPANQLQFVVANSSPLRSMKGSRFLIPLGY